MRIEIDYNGSTAICKITEFHGNPEVLINFDNADEFSQLLALSAFDCVRQHWERGKSFNKMSKDGKNSNT